MLEMQNNMLFCCYESYDFELTQVVKIRGESRFC